MFQMISNLAVPLALCLVFWVALVRRVDILSAFAKGVREGARVAAEMFPSLLLLTLAIGMLEASGGLSLLCKALEPLAQKLRFAPPLIPLTLLRPLSGSGALVVFQNILSNWGADSAVGKIAEVMMGSTETTFYTIAMYCSAAGIKKSRYAAPASLCADLAGFCASVLTVHWLLS